MDERPLYNIGAITRLTGIPIATLHAWERRYGFPRSARTPGGHRLFSEKDVFLLRRVKEQLGQGLSARQAVAAIRTMDEKGLLSAEPPFEIFKTEERLPTPAALTEQLKESLLHHELDRADQLMGEMLAFYSPEQLTLDVIGPVLNEIGEDWEQGRISVADEHLASNYLRHRLLMWMVTGPRPRLARPVVLACPPGEWHEGSLLMLGVLLRRQGWPVAYLGQNVPYADLAGFVRQIRPSVVVLAAMRAETARSLADWPQWIQPVGGSPVVAFGGRAFTIQPELQGLVPGNYLGDTIQQGLESILGILEPGKQA